MIHTDITVLNDVLASHAVALGDDFTAYRNHTYRVLNLCAALCEPNLAQLEKMAIAAAHHDVGIWTDRTFDYLAPSMKLAREHLLASGKQAWIPEIEAMIEQHHKISTYKAHPEWLVEPFRKADLVDVSFGLISFGLPRGLLRDLFSAFPDAGFHKRLVALSSERLLSHPLSPLPMLRW